MRKFQQKVEIQVEHVMLNLNLISVLDVLLC